MGQGLCLSGLSYGNGTEDVVWAAPKFPEQGPFRPRLSCKSAPETPETPSERGSPFRSAIRWIFDASRGGRSDSVPSVDRLPARAEHRRKPGIMSVTATPSGPIMHRQYPSLHRNLSSGLGYCGEYFPASS